jgi:hypothetical protein
MIRQTERTTPHRQYIASYEDRITRKSVNHNPFIEPQIFSGIGAELMGGSHYIQSTIEKFDKMSFQKGMPLPDLRFHPDTLAIGENHLKTIYTKKKDFFESAENDIEVPEEQRDIEGEELESKEDNEELNRLFSGGRRRRKRNK